MLEWEGKMIDKRDRNQIILSDVHEKVTLSEFIQISIMESKMIDNLHQRSDYGS